MDALYKVRKPPTGLDHSDVIWSYGLQASRLTGNPLEERRECMYFVRIVLRRERTFLNTSNQHNI
jgi:hypothetical protein